METKNLPAKKELNIFTSEKNIDTEILNEILKSVKQAKKIKLINADGFNSIIYKTFENINIDTIMHLYTQYNFSKPEIRTHNNNTMYAKTAFHVKDIAIDVFSEFWNVNILPNEIQKIINPNN